MSHQIIFETDRLIVRRYIETDQDNFYSLHGNKDVMRFIRAVQTRGQSDKFLSENILFYAEYPLMGRWAVEEKITKRFVGSFAVIFIPASEKIQLGYSLQKEEWGKGFATELTKEGLKYVFEIMKLPLIYAVTVKENIASQKVLLKAGFAEESRYNEEDKELIRFIIYNE